MSRFIITMIFCIGLISPTIATAGKSCTTEEAIAAEDEAASLETWDEVFQSFKKFSKCDDGAIGEGYSASIADLLANDWETVIQLNSLVSRDKKFKIFILGHVDELISLEQAQKIYKNVRQHCPTKAKELCKLVEKRLDETPSERGQ